MGKRCFFFAVRRGLRETPAFITNGMLVEIRGRADWRRVFEALGLERTKGGNENDWWARSPFSEDRHPSFHIGERGWYCFSTGQGGGVIELVQKVMGERLGQKMNCYEAGRWLVENGLSSVEEPGEAGLPGGVGIAGEAGADMAMAAIREETAGRSGAMVAESEAGAGKGGRLWDGGGRTGMGSSEDVPRENRPIRQTLVPLLEAGHDAFSRRGISRATCEALGCGYLPQEKSKSPLRGRIVFPVRGVQADADGRLQPVILTHIGRAVTEEEAEQYGKWRVYEGFQKNLELYSIDRALLDEGAVRQAKETGRVLVTEGCFDVAKLWEADIRNVVATFGAHLHEGQLRRLDLIAEKTGVKRFLFCYDRDRAGREGMEKALERIRAERAGRYEAGAFDWERAFPSPARGPVKIPAAIGDVCELSVEQLRWLRGKSVI